MWVLILTLVVRPLQPGVAIATAEFNSELRCKAAGQAWIADQRRIPSNEIGVYPSAVCSYK